MRRTVPQGDIARLITIAEESSDTIRGLMGPDRAMLYALAVGTGLRASEIGSLTTASLSLADDPPTVVVEAAYSKRRRRDVQPLPLWLAERLRKWLAARPSGPTISSEPQLLWPGSWSRHAAKMLRGDLAAAEIDFRDDAGRVFDFHALRHQFISNLAEAGVHPRTAQELARHSSIDLTMKRYTHLAMRNVVGAVESVPDPMTKASTTLRATGTDDDQVFDQSKGDARVTAKATGQGQNCHLSTDRSREKSRVKKLANLLPLQEFSEAEGTRLELATGFPAPHFQLCKSCT